MPRSKNPIVVCVDYFNNDGVRAAIEEAHKGISKEELHYLLDYPTVYIIHRDRYPDRKDRRPDGKAYVGETGNIEARTYQHRKTDKQTGNKDIWEFFDHPDTSMYLIGHHHFNKSLTLDIENRLIGYILASDYDATLGVTNGRTNPQLEYYTQEEFETIVSKAWRELNRHNKYLFPAEQVIKNSAIFKASPFHRLSEEQQDAEDKVLKHVAKMRSLKEPDLEQKQLIIVEGMAGTGKTVLLSHLFLELTKQYSRGKETEQNDEAIVAAPESDFPIALVVNHDEQETVYNAIMKRLGLQKKNGEIVFKATPFINKYSETKQAHEKEGKLAHQLYPTKELDVVLIDEAHLLFTSGNQSYVGHRNQLWDILDRAKTVVAVFDMEQILRSSQELSDDISKELFPSLKTFGIDEYADIPRIVSIFDQDILVSNIRLEQQFRIDAGNEIVAWIDDFASGRSIGAIPVDTKKRSEGEIEYEIRVFDSPGALYREIEKKNNDTEQGLSRVVATYDWPFKRKERPNDNNEELWSVSLKKGSDGFWAIDESTLKREDLKQSRQCGTRVEYFSMPWNLQLDKEDTDGSISTLAARDASWAERPETLYEVGSIYTIQGFDLNYVGVIVGPSVCYRDGKIVFDPNKSCNYQAIHGSENPEVNLQHELNVLLKRGVHGLYLFAVDKELQEHLMAMQAE